MNLFFFVRNFLTFYPYSGPDGKVFILNASTIRDCQKSFFFKYMHAITAI